MSEEDGVKSMGQVIQIDEARIRDHLGEMVRGTVEETLNAMLDAEVDQLCGAGRYERSQVRQDTRAGSYERSLQTQTGEVNLKVPKLRLFRITEALRCSVHNAPASNERRCPLGARRALP
jgi:putative transposase